MWVFRGSFPKEKCGNGRGRAFDVSFSGDKKRSGILGGVARGAHVGYDEVVGRQDFVIFFLECADEGFLADLERGNVYLDRIGQVGRKGAHLKFAGIDRQNATGANAFGVTGDLYRNDHRDRLVVEELHEIHVQDVLRDGVELQVLQSRFERLARGEFQIYDECIRRVNQRIQILGIHRKVNRIFTAVDYTRHTTSIT